MITSGNSYKHLHPRLTGRAGQTVVFSTVCLGLNIDFDFVITVCDTAKERCPYFPTKTKKFHQNFRDPAKSIGTKEEIMQQFRKVRQMIKDYSQQFVTDNL
jgi:protein-tyrosine-phosphatase